MQTIIKMILLFTIMVFSYLSTYAEDTITIVYGAKYEPFAWGNLEDIKGVQPDFVQAILVDQMGLKVKHEGYPWKRCQNMVRSGQKDGFFTVPTEERAEYTDTTSSPFYVTHFVMHTGKDNPIVEQLKTVNSLEDLEKMADVRHIHMLGSGWHENALQNMKKVHKLPDASTIPVLLSKNRADLYIEQDEMFRYQAQKAGVSDEILTIKKPSIRQLGWHIFIGKESKHAHLIPKINATLKKLEASGELEKIKLEIFKKYGI